MDEKMITGSWVDNTSLVSVLPSQISVQILLW